MNEVVEHDVMVRIIDARYQYQSMTFLLFTGWLIGLEYDIIIAPYNVPFDGVRLNATACG